jgi:hypothetical protein
MQRESDRGQRRGVRAGERRKGRDKNVQYQTAGSQFPSLCANNTLKGLIH